MRVAVVAAACEFAESSSPAELWRTVVSGRRCFRALPARKFALADYAGDGPDSIYPIEVALIEGWRFDRAAFNIPLSTYERTDFAHWLALDVAARAWRTLGVTANTQLADETAVIVANTLTGEVSRAATLRYRWPYVERAMRAAAPRIGAQFEEFLRAVGDAYRAPFPPPDEDSLAGSLSNTIAGRISNHFGLRGGAHSVDGACASSLIAVVNACEKLAAGDVQCAIVGAVDLSLDPFELVGFARNGALARDTMRVFDRRSQGFWPGEGCGVLVLATEEAAEANGWPVLGWIMGAAMSTDGCGSLTLPTMEGQVLAGRRAWRRAGLDPAGADYFEAHGTGTAVGDPIELRGLAALVGHDGSRVTVGSIKAQVGHTKAAAGMAGLLKALWVCSERVLPATAGCEEPHAVLQEEVGKRVCVRDAAKAIGHSAPVTAGVNSFGFGGVNCHVVVQGPARAATWVAPRLPQVTTETLGGELLLVAAESREALVAKLGAIEARTQTLARSQLADIASALAGEDAGPWRACLIAATPHELRQATEDASASLAASRAAIGGLGGRFEWSAPCATQPRIAVVYPGQGLGLDMRPRAWAQRFPRLASGIRAIEHASADLSSTAVVQPLLAEIAIATTRLLGQFGLRPHSVLGHSFGELSALHASGSLDDETFRALAQARGDAMGQLAPDGAMVAVHTDLAAASQIASANGVEVACHNGPNDFVLAGAAVGVEAARRDCVARGIAARVLPSTRAFHTRQMEAARAAFEPQALGLRAQAPNAKVVSTVTGQPLETGYELAGLLPLQFTAPVLFAQALGHVRDFDVVIDASSGGELSGLMSPQLAREPYALEPFGASLRALLRILGAAWVRGAEVDISSLFAGRVLRPCRVDAVPLLLSNPCGVQDRAAAVELRQDEPPRATNIAPAHAAGMGALTLLRGVLAEISGLPMTGIEGGMRLLSDLHLNSIKARYAVAQAARLLQVAELPFDLAFLARATVDDAAAWLQGLASGAPEAAEAIPEGIAPWLRTFSHEWRAAPVPTHCRMAEADKRRLVVVGGERDENALQTLLRSAQQCAADADENLLVVQQAQIVNAFLQSFAAEHPGKRICAVEVEQLDTVSLAKAVAVFTEDRRGYAEARMRCDELQRRTFEITPEGDAKRAWTPSADDVIVFAGGAKGIGAHASLALAQAAPSTMAIVGRSAADSAEVVAHLDLLRTHGTRVLYVQADLARGADAAAAMATIRSRLSAPTAFFHAAGVNEPCIVTHLQPEVLRASVAAKTGVLRNVLAHLDTKRLKLLVSFGSLIGERGLAGEAHYALANEWLREELLDLAKAMPACAVVPISWTAWRAGMAQRLEGVIDSLHCNGIRPIEPGEGTAALQQLLAAPPTSSVVVAGRWREPVEASDDLRSLYACRFLAAPRVVYRGVELVADAEISTDTDKYLTDHAPDGMPLLPLVMALEAMGSAVSCVGPGKVLSHVTQLRAYRPVSVPRGKRVVLRTLALVDSDGSVRVEVRTDEDRFRAPQFSATFSPTGRQTAVALERDEAPGVDGQVLYGSVCFHGSHWQRVGCVTSARALQCRAITAPRPDGAWFSSLLPRQLQLGDAGARDALLHALQACMPHEVVLPVSVESIRWGVLDAAQAYEIRARQTARIEDGYVFDAELRGSDGQVVESWSGILFQRAPSLTHQAAQRPLPVELLAPLVERLAADHLIEDCLRAGTAQGGREQGASRAALKAAAGDTSQFTRDSDGRWRCPGLAASTSHSGDITLAAISAQRDVAIDLETDVPREPGLWAAMLGAQRMAFAAQLQGASTDLQPACSMTWCISETLSKLGIANWPLDAAAYEALPGTRLPHLVRVRAPGLDLLAGALNLTGREGLTWFAIALQPLPANAAAPAPQPIDVGAK